MGKGQRQRREQEQAKFDAAKSTDNVARIKSYCNCNGTIHPVVTLADSGEDAMCGNCGNVICTAQTTKGYLSGPCLFCKASMAAPGVPPQLQRDETLSMPAKSNLTTAVQFREELISRVQRKTRVTDDQGDWYPED